jgi:hypothetical protein
MEKKIWRISQKRQFLEGVIYLFIYLLLFIYSHVHTLFGSFLHPAPHPPRSVSGRSRSALVTDFVEEKT